MADLREEILARLVATAAAVPGGATELHADEATEEEEPASHLNQEVVASLLSHASAFAAGRYR